MFEKILENLNQGNISILAPIFSFVSGIISSLTPCTLSILPLIIGYCGIDENKNYKKTFIKMLCLISGLALVMSVFGVSCAFGGNIFMMKYRKIWLVLIASLIMIFGLDIVGIIDIEYKRIVKNIPKQNNKNEFLYAFLIGMVYALASTPCATPFLAAILSFASITKNVILSGIMLFLFALGQGIILIVAGLFTTFTKKVRSLNHIFNFIFKLSGIMLIGIAIYIWKITIFS